MENSTISAPATPEFAGQNHSQTHHHLEPDHHHHHHAALPSTSILLIVIPIFIVILLLAIFLLIVMLRKLQNYKSHGSIKSGSIITNNDCMFSAHSSINISSSPDVRSRCLYGSSGNKMAASKCRGVQVFTYKELEMATNKFSAANVIGNGGYGVVYRGILSDGTVAAIKMLHRQGKQGERAFRLESTGENGSLVVDYFTFSSSIADYLRSASLVISHAGSGSIFETLRLQKPLIVVVNEDLMDNHQSELAEELAERKHLFCARPQTLYQTIANMDLGLLIPYQPGDATPVAEFINSFLGFPR